MKNIYFPCSFSLCCFLAAVCGSVIAQSRFSIEQKWSFDSFGDDLGRYGIVAKDIDKNGRPEMILSNTKEGSDFATYGYFSVVEYNPTTLRYETKWVSRLFFNEITAVQIFDINNDATDEILIGLNNGEIKVFDTHYKEVNSLFTVRRNPSPFSEAGVSSIAFEDIDNDGQKNLVATNGDTTYVFGPTLRVTRKILMKGGRITLSNVDVDPAIESIYSNGMIVEYNSVGAKSEFRFFPSPYSIVKVRVADMNKDGTLDVVYNSQDSVHVLNVRTKQRMRSIAKKQASGYVSDFQLYDYTLDGVPDLFVGNEQFDVLYVYNGQTTQYAYSLQDPKRNGLDALLIADMDGAPGAELVWTSGVLCSCSDHFFVYDMNTKNMKWMSKYTTGGFQAFDVGNIDAPTSNNPTDELVIANYGAYTNYFDHDFITSFTLPSKSVKKELTTATGGINNLTAMKIGDIDNDGKNEILEGIETSYSQTSVRVLDEQFNLLRTFEADGMSYVADIEISDIDGDHKNEVIVTSGTNVGGSTHPDEWQNYIYIFDGKTGSIKWKSQKLAAMSSRIGNIVVGNIDNDAAQEVIVLQYKTNYFFPPTSSAIYVIDGWNYQVTKDESLAYNALALADFDNDGIEDIIAGTSAGKILVVDGKTFAVKKEITSGKGVINALEAVDLTGDDVEEYIFTNPYKLMVYNAVHATLTETDTLSDATGLYGSLRVHKNNPDDVEILISTTHTLLSFRLTTITSNPDIEPSAFALLTPINNGALASPEWIQFSWSQSDTDILYSIHITGASLDTTVTDISQTHIAFPARLFTAGNSYSWSVTASNGQQQTVSESFTFQVTEEVILGITPEGNQSHYQVSPNPFQQSIVIRNLSPFEIDGIKIFNMQGVEQLAKNISIPVHSEATVDDAGSLASGMYVCTLMTRGFPMHTVKIIKH